MNDLNSKLPDDAYPGQVASAQSADEQSIIGTPSGQANVRRCSHPTAFALKPISLRKLVLVVEDELLMLNFLQDSLRTENYERLAPDDPRMALEWVERGIVPDLLTTDVTMPEMTRISLSQKLRAVVPALPVLFETGNADQLFQKDLELQSTPRSSRNPLPREALSKRPDSLCSEPSIQPDCSPSCLHTPSNKGRTICAHLPTRWKFKRLTHRTC